MSKKKHETGTEEDGLMTEVPQELLEHPSYQEIQQKLEDAEQKAQQNWDRVVRMQAENENILRRAERDVTSAHKYALDKFVGELIPIIDSLELCVSSVPENTDGVVTAVIEGVQMTLKMFYTAMDKFGIKQVNPVSEPFNPEFEQAISTQEDPSVKPGTIISVLQKGYTLNNRLIRPALVVVAKAKE